MSMLRRGLWLLVVGGVTPMAIADEPQAPAQLALVGDLVPLVRDSSIHITSSLSPQRPVVTGSGGEFPIRLSRADFGAAFVDILNPQGERSLAVLYCRPLFPDGKDETLRLDRPRLELRVRRHGSSGLALHYFAWIDNRVCYAAMPRYNQHEARLKTPSLPKFAIAQTAAPDSEIATADMVSGCCGYGWMAFPDLTNKIAPGDTLVIRVTHDSGDLWGTLETTSRYAIK